MLAMLKKLWSLFFQTKVENIEDNVTSELNVETITAQEPKPEIYSKPLRILSEEEREERKQKLAEIRSRRELSERIDDLLTLLDRANFDKANSPHNYVAKAQQGLFDGDLYFLDGSDSDITESMIDNEILFLGGEDRKENAEAIWPIDFGMLVDHGDNYYSIMRTKSVDAKYLRGKTKLVPPKAVISYSGEIMKKSGQAWAESTHMGLINNKWRVLDGMFVDHEYCRGYDSEFRFKADRSIHMTLSCALTARYHWHVAFQSKSGVRLLVPTTPHGCLKMFKDRKGPAEGRRKALKHWVTNHYRKTPADQNDLRYVRDYLRGNTLFNWRGIECELLVSAYDLEKNELFREQAEQWRSQRKHNSKVRVKIKSYKNTNTKERENRIY